MSATKSTLPFSPADIILTFRQIDVEWVGEFEKVWINNAPLISHMLNLLSVSFDATETLIINAVRRVRTHIKNPTLKANTVIFVQQEAAHRKQHRKLNQLLCDWGYARIPLIIEKQYVDFGPHLRSDSDLGAMLRIASRFEHLTSYVSRFFLTLLDNNYGNMDPHLAYLFGYHAAEEIEHKGVIFDCYTELFGHTPFQHEKHEEEWEWFNRQLRLNLTHGVYYFISIDNIMNDTKIDADVETVENALFGQEGIFSPDSDYFKFTDPNFHPWQQDDRCFIKKWDDYWAPRIQSQIHER